MRDLRAVLRSWGFDALVVAAAAVSALEVAFRREAPDAPTSPLLFAIPAIVLLFVPLLARRRFPFGAPAAVWVVAVVVSFVDGRLIVFPAAAVVAGMAAALLLGTLRDDFQARVGLVLTLTAAGILLYNKPNHTAGELVFVPVMFVIAWTVGMALRARGEQAEAAEDRAERAELERETAARVAVAEERARIARELHDVVAHAMSVIVLQVGAVRHDLPEGESRRALEDVERTGRSALAEMRRLLGAMRRDSDDVEFAPQPGLAALEPLLADVRRTGLEVELEVEGEPAPLPHALDLSAYRIVQEGLTNVLKHAHASRADVRVVYAPDELRLEVRDDGRGNGASDGAGHGLVGVRERVKIYGGDLVARPLDGRGFLLGARLPIVRDAR
jgi:signal transduction histidine kinase